MCQHHLKYTFITIIFAVFMTSYITTAATIGESQLVFNWTHLEFDWPTDAEEAEAIRNGSFVPERNLLAGIKVYKNEVYVTIPRWTWTSGHPVTLAKVVNVQGKFKLRPYPNWAAQKQGNCQALQYVQSMEIDPNTGYMYAIDSGRVGDVLNLCPAKIVVYDLNTDKQIESYEMPANVASLTHNAMNDIVLDYVDGKVRYAYISDVGEGRVHAYDFQTRSAHNLEDPSMKREGNNGTIIHINNKDYTFPGTADGIAISPDFKYVYYCTIGGYNLYQVPTSLLRDPHSAGNTSPRLVGRKISQSDGLAYGSKHLYYGALGLNAVYYWDSQKDIDDQKVNIDKVTLATQVELVRDDNTIVWPDTFGFDDQGWLWIVANSLNTFQSQGGNPKNRIWKVFVNETSYLFEADRRTRGTIVG